MRAYHFGSPPSRRNDWKTIKSLLPYLWEFRARVIIALVLLVGAKVANVAVPLLLKRIVDALNKPHVVLVLPIALLVGYGLLRLTSSLFGELRDAVFAKVTQRAIRRVANEMFEHLHGLSLRFHLERQTGGVSRDIERGTRGISFLLNFMLFNILPTLVEIALVAAVLLAKYAIVFSLVTFLTLGLYIGFTLIVTEWRMVFRRTMNDMDSKANTRAIDSLLNYETVKYFGNEAYESRRYDDSMRVWETAAVRNQTSLAFLNAGQSAIIAIGVTLLMVLAGEGVVNRTMTIGDLVLVNVYMLQLYQPLHFLGFVYREIRHSLADMERMFTLLDEHAEVADKPNAPPLAVTQGRVSFEHVDFGYRPDRQILHDVSFEIPSGTTVAVVGPSGAGKSTLSRLIFRFFDVQQGRITIDGQDVREVTQKSLRGVLGIVPQDTVLFNDTIYYNILYGRPEASRDEVIAAAQHAHIHDFVESLPDRYDTVVGERGLKLSGGEKQRVAIARTILKNPPILVFDEATSALDSKSEKAIQGELQRIARDRTTLVIAHRLSTIVDADEILVMDHGRIVERGTHRQLLTRAGMYAHMWALQLTERESDERPMPIVANGLAEDRPARSLAS
ncbi:MAG: ABC transporter ATP-binding protein/permease [Betaproteobacteria bacterium]|nr:ABC transporter ATP-binding protein/permease [Betaproteobacteria bacterium]